MLIEIKFINFLNKSGCSKFISIAKPNLVYFFGVKTISFKFSMRLVCCRSKLISIF